VVVGLHNAKVGQKRAMAQTETSLPPLRVFSITKPGENKQKKEGKKAGGGRKQTQIGGGGKKKKKEKKKAYSYTRIRSPAA
jgi:hypothetical protein